METASTVQLPTVEAMAKVEDVEAILKPFLSKQLRIGSLSSLWRGRAVEEIDWGRSFLVSVYSQPAMHTP
jgi:hypothetical protein